MYLRSEIQQRDTARAQINAATAEFLASGKQIHSPGILVRQEKKYTAKGAALKAQLAAREREKKCL